MERLRHLRAHASDFKDTIDETVERVDLAQGCVRALLLAAEGMKARPSGASDASAVTAVAILLQGELNMIESNMRYFARQAD